MKEIKLTADELVAKLLNISVTENICLLDSCGENHPGSHLLIAGINPSEMEEISNDDAQKSLVTFDKKLKDNQISFFTISYDFGLQLENIKPRQKEIQTFPEPDIFLAVFDCLIIHDYKTGKTSLAGNEIKCREIESRLAGSDAFVSSDREISAKTKITSNFSKNEYLAKIKHIRDLIRAGETYQTNLTQQFRAELPKDLSAQQIFWNLRKSHPAPFTAFIKRKNDYVVSISPERFFQIDVGRSVNTSDSDQMISRLIKTSPIKGTRPRGTTPTEDLALKTELQTSPKDRAENTMIVDLLRNDIGRVCQYGSVKVEKLCDLEVHPSLFHLVSTVSGKLRNDVSPGDIVKAIFPCGSITGCPKIRTMQIIDKLETVNRGLSMGAIGYSVPASLLANPKNKDKKGKKPHGSPLSALHSSVAIRTMVIRHNQAIFNVGGGIVIDSDPEDEYKESLLKAKALLNAIGVEKL